MTNCPSCKTPLKEEHARFCANCGAMIPQSGPPSADPLLGKVIAGRFRLTSVLGEGGMGKVYLAEQKMGASTRKVAVKTLHGDIAGDPQVVQRFQRECDTVNQLTHPNTITLYDFGDWEGTLYIAMEYLQGESVAQALVRMGPFEPTRAERILMQVCGSLHEAHEHGIVHRDLKPENVLLTTRGGARDFVKVLDFGIAKRNEGEDPATSQKLTRQGMVLGTPPYMSPEQFTGQVLDRRSDLYSLGVMAYEMLTGKLPFDAKTPWEWATKHLTTAPEPMEVHDKAGRLQARHKSAIMRALKKNRDERQGSVMEFLQELTGVQDPSMGWGQVTTPAPVGMPAPGHVGVPTPGPIGVPTPSPIGVPTPGIPTPGPTTTAPPGGWVSPGTPGPSPAFPATAWAGAVTPSRSIPTPMTAGGAMVTPAPMPQVSTGGGGGKIVAIVLLVLIVLGGGGAAAWFAFRPAPTPPVVQPTPPLPPTPPLGPREVPTTPDPIPPTPPRPQGPDPVVIAPMPPPTNPVPNNTTRPPDVMTPVLRPTPPTPPTPPPPHNPPTKNTKAGPSAADVQRGRQLAASGVSQARLGNLDAGLAALREATRLAGRNDPTVSLLRQTVGVAGGTKVGMLIQQRRCLDAQMLFTRLRSAGAGDLARRHFTADCPAR